MKKTLLIITLISSSIAGQTSAGTPKLPTFLPKYYSSVFNNLDQLDHSTVNDVDQWTYSTKDQSMGLSIELIKCDTPSGKAIFNNILGYINKQIEDNSGQFIEITKTEMHSKILEEDVERGIFAFILPSSIQIWTFTKQTGSAYPVQDKFKIIKSMVNRHRYTQALKEGNVSMGAWEPQIYEFASTLLQNGKQKESVRVLKNLLATSPYNYQAHLDFLMNSDDRAAAASSAKIIMENTESPELLNKAAKFLVQNPDKFESIPILSKNETGLQVILIPLLPCSPWFLDEIAELYQTMTDVPVKIRRLKERWDWSVPNRIPHQRRVTGILIKMKGEKIDFTNWTKKMYVDALRSYAKKEDAISKYYIEGLITKIEEDQGQYLVNPHLDRFCEALKAYRSKDNRTMYVGITETNIYSGDNNYVFSLGRDKKGDLNASILSYHMMLASSLQEGYESQQRLTERIAKELVPASFKQLGIPRSTDPRCPYSYSSGVSRLDQKTLNLSDTLKDALKKLKDDLDGQ